MLVEDFSNYGNEIPGLQKQELSEIVDFLLQPNATRISHFYALELQTFVRKTATSLSGFSSCH